MNKSAWFDRITGRIVYEIPNGDVPGRWVLRAAKANIRMNRTDLLAGLPFFLVPDHLENWAISSSDQGESHAGRFAGGLLPTVSEVRALKQIAVPIYAATDLASMLRVPPLPADLDETVHSQILDQEIKDRLLHLEKVCHRPRQQLRAEYEKVPVARAKRIPIRSLEYLTAHSEDWVRRTGSGIEPKNVIAEFADDQIDIYENRVAAELVDKLGGYLRDRLTDLNRVIALLSDHHEFQMALQNGRHFMLATRISLLWKEIHATAGLSTIADATKKDLDAARHRVKALPGTKLYKEVSKKRELRPELFQTNILEKDSNYLEVAHLWRAYHAHGEVPKKSEIEVFHNWQDANRDFSAYCRLIVLRAAKEVGWMIDGVDVPVLTETIALKGPRGDVVQLASEVTGVMTLSALGSRQLRVVPLLAALSEAQNLDKVQAWFETLEEESGGHDILILYLGKSNSLVRVSSHSVHLQMRLESLAADSQKVGGNLWVLPVGPFEITSIEKVGRLLNGWLRGPMLREFPPQISCSESFGSYLQLDRFANFIGTNKWICESSIQEKVVADVRDKISKIGHPEIRRQVGNVSENAIATVNRDLDQARTLFTALVRCPVCSRENGRLIFRDRDTFLCTCSSDSCKASWGLLVCGKCSGTYPHLSPLSPLGRSAEDAVDFGPGWLGRTYGRDCIAVPCKRRHSPGGFVCPHCMKCSAPVDLVECIGCPAAL